MTEFRLLIDGKLVHGADTLDVINPFWVNKHLDLGPDIPYAGAKQSGIGTELGQEGLEEFTQSNIINVAK